MNIVISGVSRGVGFELVKLYTSNKENTVVGITRNISELSKWKVENKIDNLHLFSIDIGNDNASDEINRALSLLNTVDLLINNAGKLINKPFLEQTRAESESIFAVNYFGALEIIKACLPKMGKTENRAHVVNIGSMGGFQGTQKFSGLNSYSASKAAISCLTECLAEEYKTKNISFNCITLGAVQTEMLAEAFPGYQAPFNAKQAANFINTIALMPEMINGKIIPMSASTP